MRFYVASGLENLVRVKRALEKIRSLGHDVSYDWTQHGDVRTKGMDALNAVAGSETFAVMDSDRVLILLPGGKGTHTELGIALASRASKRIILWSETGEEFESNKNTCAFYHHSAVEKLRCSFEELLNFIETI